MSFEGTLLEHFSAKTQLDMTSEPESQTRNSVFRFIFLIIKNKMLSQQLQTENTLLDC